MPQHLLEFIWNQITNQTTTVTHIDGYRVNHQLRIYPNKLYKILLQNKNNDDMISDQLFTCQYFQNLLQTPWPENHDIYECIGITSSAIHILTNVLSIMKNEPDVSLPDLYKEFYLLKITHQNPMQHMTMDVHITICKLTKKEILQWITALKDYRVDINQIYQQTEQSRLEEMMQTCLQAQTHFQNYMQTMTQLHEQINHIRVMEQDNHIEYHHQNIKDMKQNHQQIQKDIYDFYEKHMKNPLG